ncbi:MAG TPA: hypothetical protein VLG38_00020 [Gammaproteobacteria bacterium]|nr:hypothetical protein [Gammaproteobacteria bacterium]
MSSDDKDNKLFDKIKQKVDSGHTLDSAGQEAARATIEQQKVAIKEALERELLKRLSKEKHRLAAELEIQFKEASVQRAAAQEQKFVELLAKERDLLAKEKQQYAKALKEKFTAAMKVTLQEREQQLAEKLEHKHYAADAEARQAIDNLKLQLAQQQQDIALQINQAKIAAKQEQEKASRAVYENLLQASRDDISRQAESKIQAEYLRREIELKRQYEANLQQQTAKIMASYEDKLRTALFEQEQAFFRNNADQLVRQKDQLNQRVQQEVDAAVAAATNKLELEFLKEKQALHAKLERLKPELEAARVRMRAEVEAEVRAEIEAAVRAEVETKARAEFEAKLAQYKQKFEMEKQFEIQTQLAAEKQKIADALQEDNNVVLKYKELQLQAEIAAERVRVTEKANYEKKTLLQQQETMLREQFATDLEHQLAQQEQQLAQQHQLELRSLELKVQDAQHQALSFANQYPDPVPRPSPKLTLEVNTNDPHLVAAPATTDPEIIAAEKRIALQNQERALRAEFDLQLQAAREEWERERGVTYVECELQAREQTLRKEFQFMLEQQRMQTAANFAKQRDVEITSAIAKHRQKMLNEMQISREQDLVAAEEALKAQYAERIQQQSELARIEVERTKESLIAEQAERIRMAVDMQLDAVRKEQELKFAKYAEAKDQEMQELLDEERQKLHIKFAQDKANLIKELTAKFTREKHISMNQYETELREKLYSEMVKQKDFIQTKFTQAQESALQEQKRRLEAQHKHEIERIKQGFFDPSVEDGKHDAVFAERNVEQLANRILAKFQKQS